MKTKRIISFVLALTLVVSLSLTGILVPEAQASTSDSAEWEVLKIVNQQRISQGVDPLTTYTALEAAAAIRAEEITESFSHTRPDGTSCFTVFKEVDVSYGWAGENIAYGYPTAANVMNGWMNSDGHRRNILSANFSHIGIGKVGTYWVQMFTGKSTYTSMSVSADSGLCVEPGTTIEDMALTVTLVTTGGLECYMPLDEAYCTGYDPDSTGKQTVTVSALGVSTTFTVYVGVDSVEPPVITAHPVSQNVKSGATAKFTVNATGSDLKYQWQYRTSSSGSWKNSGAASATTATFSIKGTNARNEYQYRCKITDIAGNTVYTKAATLYVLYIYISPSSATVANKATAYFSVYAIGDGLEYQWQYRTSSSGKWKNSGAASANTADFSIKGTAARNGYQYRCKITDSAGNTVYSKAVTLTVSTCTIITQPEDITVATGTTATFTVKTSGKGLKYQWEYWPDYHDGWKISGATTAKTTALSIKGTTARNGYQYRCKITDANGVVIYTQWATLTVK